MLVFAWERGIQGILFGLFVAMSQLAWAMDTDQRQVVDGL